MNDEGSSLQKALCYFTDDDVRDVVCPLFIQEVYSNLKKLKGSFL